MATPFDQRPDLIWFDGKLIPTFDCKISVLTHGLHYASAVFEGERAYGGEIFRSLEHSERLKRSAQIMDFEIPFTVAEIEAAKRLVIEKNNQKEAYVRAIAWRGWIRKSPTFRAKSRNLRNRPAALATSTRSPTP